MARYPAHALCSTKKRTSTNQAFSAPVAISSTSTHRTFPETLRRPRSHSSCHVKGATALFVFNRSAPQCGSRLPHKVGSCFISMEHPSIFARFRSTSDDKLADYLASFTCPYLSLSGFGNRLMAKQPEVGTPTHQNSQARDFSCVQGLLWTSALLLPVALICGCASFDINCQSDRCSSDCLRQLAAANTQEAASICDNRRCATTVAAEEKQ